MSDPKILIIDIETSPISAHVWELWDQNVGLEQIEAEWSILAYCAKWLGKREMTYRCTGGNGPDDVRNDRDLLAEIWVLLDEADIVVAQNGKKFDIKKINARLMMEDFPPYSPIRVVDTLTSARRYFGFTSNKLAWLSKHLTDTPKSDHRKFPGFELWIECLEDNPKAWDEMEKYNKRDVIACERLYLKLRPWIADHPNLAAYGDKSKCSCPKCGSGRLEKRGYSVTQNGRYQRYQCTDCGGWSRGKDTLLDLKKRRSLLV